jgi:hypothetical protein
MSFVFGRVGQGWVVYRQEAPASATLSRAGLRMSETCMQGRQESEPTVRGCVSNSEPVDDYGDDYGQRGGEH